MYVAKFMKKISFFYHFRLENDKLKQQLKKKDEEIVQSRATLERFTNAVSKKKKKKNQ